MRLSAPLIIGSGIVLAGVIAAVVFFVEMGDNRGYAPEQPIPFDHAKHAGQYAIDCQYCHSAVDRSRHATIPSVETCMNCHRVVKTESPHIQKIHEAFKSGHPIEWVKVHDMPDHVAFNHKRHIAKGIDCTVCHGDVEDMQQMKQMKSLNMGFCINCHRAEKAPITCEACHQ
jgi:hypothetical protein